MNNKSSKNNSKILLIIGVFLLVLGIALTVYLGITYKQKYEEWKHEWFDLGTATINEQPIPLFPIGIFVTFASFPLIFMGLTPKVMKNAHQHSKDIFNTINKDMSGLEKEFFDDQKAYFEKKTNESNSSESDNTSDSSNTKITCPICGDEVDKDEEFCSNCGTKLNIKCSKCGYKNSVENNYCKKCGTRLK